MSSRRSKSVWQCGVLFAATVLVILAGCGSQMSEADIRSSEQAYADATAAFERGDFATAEVDYTRAIQGGGLLPDLYSTAIINRARCYTETGKYEEAMQDLKLAEQGAPDLGAVYAAQAYVHLKKGDKVTAKSLYTKARENGYSEKLPAGI